jgi:hypothetical protein
MLVSQEPKYAAIGNLLVNRASGVPIPDDEPVFILRAKDRRALHALREYQSVVTNHEHIQAIATRINDFESFKLSHPERMKEPDTRS